MTPKQLTSPLIVPEFGNPNANTNAKVKLYKADEATGNTIVDSAYTIGVQSVVDKLFGAGRIACPNSCVLGGYDLFLSISSSNSQAILKFPDYINDPASAIARAFVFTLDGGDYVGMAVDSNDNLYATEGIFHDNKVIKYTKASVAYPGATKANTDNYTTKEDMGNAGMSPSYFANMVFDAAGNLWVTDALNNRVVVFHDAKAGNVNDYHVLQNKPGAQQIPVSNTDTKLNANTNFLFTQPEGIDLDADGNLWVANNNDGSGDGLQNPLTTLVKLTPALQALVLASSQPVTAEPANSNISYFIYQVPNNAGTPQFGGLQVDKTSGRIFVNEEISNKGSWYDIATIKNISTTASVNELAITSTNPGNGGIALVNAIVLFMQDDSTDLGLEPHPSGTPWESIAVSVTSTQKTGTLTTLPASETVTGAAPAWVYIQIHNKGRSASMGSGVETVQLYWAKGGMGLAWPAPWKGGKIDPFTLSSMGGQIGTKKNIDIVQPDGSVIIEFHWPLLPDPTKYTLKDGHFCLLARIETSATAPFGMTYPEKTSTTQTSLNDNVINNNKIAWQNINIENKSAMLSGIIASNYSLSEMKAAISFELLNNEAKPVNIGSGELLIIAKGKALEKLNQTKFDDHAVETLGNGTFKILDPRNGINNIILKPGEILLLNMQYTPAEETKGYVVRAIQSVEDGRSRKIVGGQTFVYGEVKGYHIAPRTHCKIFYNKLYWILCGLSLFAIIASLIKRKK